MKGSESLDNLKHKKTVSFLLKEFHDQYANDELAILKIKNEGRCFLTTSLIRISSNKATAGWLGNS